MKWHSLIQATRFSDKAKQTEIRNPFLQDVDKIIYSSYFRTLQDKTQVYPLSTSSYVHTRLTHSLEASTVARSLGILAGHKLLLILKHQKEALPTVSKKSKTQNVNYTHIGFILQAAALAHDIGNPPFGHKGEEVISNFYSNLFKNNSFFRDIPNQQDFTKFNGNAQGLRILLKLAGNKDEPGLGLTYSTLATFCKYPTNNINASKIGVFSSELALLESIYQQLDIGKDNKGHTGYFRHPLTFLLEAADDICYCVADICDAYKIGLITYQNVLTLFNLPQAVKGYNYTKNKYTIALRPSIKDLANLYKKDSTIFSTESIKNVERLASHLIHVLIYIVANTFILNQDTILNGTFKYELLTHSSSGVANFITTIKEFSKEHIYKSVGKQTQELTGIKVITNVLANFTQCLVNPSQPKGKAINQIYFENKLTSSKNPQVLYDNLQKINDFIVNCTDNNLIKIYQELNGLAL